MSRSGARVLVFFLLAALIFNWLPRVNGQGSGSNSGTIDGTVYDVGSGQTVVNAKDAPRLAGVSVKITLKENGTTYQVVTDNNGYFRQGLLLPGEYTVEFSFKGPNGEAYELVTANGAMDTNILNAVVPNGLAKNYHFPLVGMRIKTAAPPTVTPGPGTPVTPKKGKDNVDVPNLNTTDASQGESFDRNILQNLPAPGIRSFDYFALLLPGVFLPPQSIGNSVGPGIGSGLGTPGQFSVNGLRSRANNFTVDGSDNNDEEVGVRRQGFVALSNQSLESIQDFTIKTGLPDSLYGRNLGAQVNAVSRVGGQEFHGSVYGFLTDSRVNARDFFDSTTGLTTRQITSNGLASGTPALFGPLTQINPKFQGNFAPLAPDQFPAGKDPYTRAQYGFVLGGPLTPDKITHFFISFEQETINASKQTNFAVPTVSQRGIFGTGATGYQITNPSTTLFPSYVDGNAFFSLFPFPNNPNGPYGANTYTQSLPNSGAGEVASGKIDRSLGPANKLLVSYNYTTDHDQIPTVGGALFSTVRSSVQTSDVSFTLASALPKLVENNFRFSYGRTGLNFTSAVPASSGLLPSDFNPNIPFLLNRPLFTNITTSASAPTFATNLASFEQAGKPNDTEFFTGPLGQLFVSGFSPVGLDVFNFPQRRRDHTLQFADQASFTRGVQTIFFGYDIRRSTLADNLGQNSRPLAAFDSTLNLGGIKNLSNGTTPQLLLGTDFVAAGAPTAFSQTQARSSKVDFSTTQTNISYIQNDFFFLDQVKFRQGLALTFGLRYQYNTVPTENNAINQNPFNPSILTTFFNAEANLNALVAGTSIPNPNNPQAAVCPAGTCSSAALAAILGNSRLYTPDKKDFAPYFAFAFDPTRDHSGKMVIRGGFGIYYDQIPGVVVTESGNTFPNFITVNTVGLRASTDTNSPSSAGSLLVLNPQRLAAPGTLNALNTAVSVDPTSFILSLANPTNFSGGAVFTLPQQTLRNPYSEQWDLSIERQFSHNIVASASYLGTRGVRLLRDATPNLGPNAIPFIGCLSNGITPSASPSNPCSDKGPVSSVSPQFTGTVTAPFSIFTSPAFANTGTAAFATAAALNDVHRPNPLLGSFTSIQSNANSIYHSMQLALSKRFGAGLTFTTAYTWSHAIDDVSDIFDLAGAPALPQDSFNLRSERGSASFDVRHRFVYSLIWEVPKLDGITALKGLQVSSIGSFQTGQPFTVLTGVDTNLDGNATDRPSTSAGIVQVGQGPNQLALPGGQSAVTAFLANPGQDGAVGRNTFRGPGFATINLAILKPIVFKDHQRIELRTEFFNLFNRAAFGLPVNQLIFPSFGQAVDTRQPNRQIQFSLKYSF